MAESSLNESRGKRYSVQDFEVAEDLGSGRTGKVFKVRLRETKFVLALKVMSKEKLFEHDDVNAIKREIEIHSHIMNYNIVRLYGYFHDTSRIYIMLEYCSMGSLINIMSHMKTLTDTIAASFIYQLCGALTYIHEKNVIHRDIKPENILINRLGQVKLSDFGCSVHHKGGDRSTRIGTLDYIAPEMIRGAKHDHKVDIWAVGVLIYEMLSNQSPFYGKDQDSTLLNIRNLNYQFPSCINKKARNLITEILKYYPIERPSAEQIASSEYVNEYSEKNYLKCDAVLPILKAMKLEKERKSNIKKAK